MTFPTYSTTDVAEYSGRSSASYPPYTTRALFQAVLLFQAATCLSSIPEGEFEASLAKEGILAMADDLVLIQPFQKAAASPFNSESIGSYSYSKTAGKAAAAATAVSKGEKTGVTFFDIAVDRLSVCGLMGAGVPSGGGIEAFEWDGLRVQGQHSNTRLVAPHELNLFAGGYTNIEQRRD